ncbi:hypothetical protein D1AOALGA4SA_636 [Olavius algarvensis Delta 1 endosymbiont]|nr:hypothetical protein D1AOALGA4SA_636 [Olavius algarvensis Delta 1 endosymbiont]
MRPYNRKRGGLRLKDSRSDQRKKLQKANFGFWNADFGFKVFCLF